MPAWLSRLRTWRHGPNKQPDLRREWAIISICLLAAVWWLAGPKQLERSNLLVQDLSARLLQRPASSEVVLVTIDEPSIEAIGRWPWRRAIHAQLVRHLSEQQPKAIGLDILFSEPDLDHPADDALLARAIADSGRVVLAVAEDAAGQAVGQLPALTQAAAAVGHVQLRVDSDGGVRRFAPIAGQPGHLHLGLAMLCLGQPHADWCQPPLPPQLQIGFAKGHPPFTTYSYIDVVLGHIPASAFRGKYVLVGQTALGLGPALATPSQQGMRHSPNVNLVGQILNGALQQRHAAPASSLLNRVFNAVPVLLALVALAVLGPSGALAACAFLWGSTLLLATLAPLWWQVAPAPAAALLLLTLAYPLWSWRRLNAAARFLEYEMRDLSRSGVLTTLQPTGVGQDMLAQRIQAVEQASRQLRQLHHFVSESLLQLPSPTLVCDPQGRILLANSAAHRYAQSLNQSLQERQDIQLLLAGTVDNETRGPLFAPQALKDVHAAFQREGQDRLGRHLLLVGRPFSAPPTTGWLLTLVDITHMRQAMAQRDQAMHFISHDIRAPIGAIITLLEMNRAFSPSSLSQTAHTPHDTETRIERYARSALELAEDFVYLARAQQHPPRQEAVELGQLIDQALDDSWTLAQTKQIRLEWQPQEREALITGDPSQLRRVLVNLLGNAIKYSPVGSRVHCNLEERTAHWVVVVRDEGDGISPEQQATLFAPFARQTQHENSSVQGLGLGLAFVHTVMQRHGAHIELDSTLGQGSSFRLVFAKRLNA